MVKFFKALKKNLVPPWKMKYSSFQAIHTAGRKSTYLIQSLQVTAQKYTFICIKRCRQDFSTQVWGFLIITKYFTANQVVQPRNCFFGKCFLQLHRKRSHGAYNERWSWLCLRQTPLTWRRSLSHLLIIFKVPKTFYLVDKIKTKKNKLSIHWWMQTNFKLFPNIQYGSSIPSWPWSVTGTVKGIKQRRKMNGYLRILQSPKVTTSTQNSNLLKASETAIHHTDTAVSRYRPF